MAQRCTQLYAWDVLRLLCIFVLSKCCYGSPVLKIMSVVAANQSSPRLLWRSFDRLLRRGQVPASNAINVDQFHGFFTDKLEAVCAVTVSGLWSTFSAASAACLFTRFQTVTIDDVISPSVGCQTRAV